MSLCIGPHTHLAWRASLPVGLGPLFTGNSLQLWYVRVSVLCELSTWFPWEGEEMSSSSCKLGTIVGEHEFLRKRHTSINGYFLCLDITCLPSIAGTSNFGLVNGIPHEAWWSRGWLLWGHLPYDRAISGIRESFYAIMIAAPSCSRWLIWHNNN